MTLIKTFIHKFKTSIPFKMTILIPTVIGLIMGALDHDAGTGIIVALLAMILTGPLCVVLGDYLSGPNADERVPSPKSHGLTA